MIDTTALDKALERWRLSELTEAIICLNMPLAWTDDGNPVYTESDRKILSTGLTAANTKIIELEAEITRLTAALVECQEAFENGRDVGER